MAFVIRSERTNSGRKYASQYQTFGWSVAIADLAIAGNGYYGEVCYSKTPFLLSKKVRL
jgi:hypothetical protein